MNLIQNRRVYESDRHYSRSDRRQQYSFLTDIELPQPVAEEHDLLVEVKAISVNPVDTKVRAGFNADTPACWAGTRSAW
jgi:NADPH:quinone reductase-like Zn-dependent oxidoreductase